MEKRILLATPTMHSEEMDFIREAFDRNWIAPLGFNCDGFELETAEYLKKSGMGHDGEVHTLCLSAGTAALHLAVKLAGIKPGDKVLCTDMTFSATVNPVVYEGGVPVFVDSERDTWNMDPAALEKAFEKHPDAKAVMLAHLYGTPAKMDEIMAICRKHGAILIEDAAEAMAANYKGKACGLFGDYAALSFNGNKIITTSGGGMLICHEKSARDKALFWATQAREPAPWYQHEELGYNYRMSNVVAGIGRGQLLHIDEHKALKEKIYRRYEEGFKGLPISMNPYMADIMEPNYWLSCMLLEKGCGVDFMDILKHLNECNVETRPLWKPMHMQPVFAENDFVYAGDYPVDEDLFSRGLCLPSDIKMTEEEQNYVIAGIRSLF